MSSTQQLLLGEGAGSSAPVFIEDVFSCFLYDGNNSVNTITNNIDLSTKGGLVWIKGRTATPIVPTFNNVLYDTTRGILKLLESNTTDAEEVSPSGLTSFTSTGFVLGSASQTNIGLAPNDIGHFVSWTFRKQPKFFDVVTYSGNSVSGRQIAHSLGSAPGFIVVKTTNAADQWCIYHRSQGATKYGLFTTAAFDTYSGTWNNTEPTSTVFTLGNDSFVNSTGRDYVAYLFAHDAGGFGLTGTDNVISCGAYTGNGSASGPSITLGYEPQWVLIKNATTAATNWNLFDNMRGMYAGTVGAALLNPNLSDAEFISGANLISPTATGFNITTTAASMNGNGDTLIYIAIRRGPMKVPKVGTNVFTTKLRTGTSTATTISGLGFPTDLVFSKTRTPSGNNPSGVDFDRLRGIKQLLTIESTGAEYTKDPPMSAFTQDGYSFIAGANDPNLSGYTYCDWNFRRAPSFFDEVCYTGDGVGTLTVYHNLAAYPELVIIKRRNSTGNWMVNTLTSGSVVDSVGLNSTSANNASLFQGVTYAEPTYMGVRQGGTLANISGATYVAYLFATCAGVSKVGTYTGNGSSQTINCGFTSGSRFVLIKAASTTGDWMVSDSARGIVAGNDPYLELNNSNAEATGEDWLDTDSTGFVINQVSSSNANTNGVTYIFLAIA